ncbi:Arc family DNA-binding protein [Pseudomonas sp. p1(2021b)]|uniref:Arc family DNA-binding protein n=1 Tax=Pseudomonas sp. p1(2021b) TaxID=2874628 RepID=UPI001CCBAC68|nr:Arc family DNA-binding protein [Pseudomonas sp. p1(2021b)]UBM23286.1 Arc family DNA-binding protein [Pseudomonas sp. p1(2021b)]
MSRSDPQFNLRLPEALKDKIVAAANDNKRSATAEILARLEASPKPLASKGLSLSTALPILGIESPHRIRDESSTYGALKDLLCLIRNAGRISEVWLAVRNGEYNRSALTVVLHIDGFMLLADHTLLTIERRAREVEVEDLIENLDRIGLLEGATSFITQKVKKTSKWAPNEAMSYLADQPREVLTRTTITRFLNLFLEKPFDFTDEQLDEYFSKQGR